MASPKTNYNTRNPTIKRIMKEMKEMSNEKNWQLSAQPLSDNIYEWHFTIRGPGGSSFEGGIYHGRILLPQEYPFKPPNIVLLTPNGRFEVGKKICLSISAHHPETWQPSWSIRTALTALIGFFPTPGNGAIGALDYPDDERQKLAVLSTSWCCSQCGSKNANALIDPPNNDDNESNDNNNNDSNVDVNEITISKIVAAEENVNNDQSQLALPSSNETENNNNNENNNDNEEEDDEDDIDDEEDDDEHPLITNNFSIQQSSSSPTTCSFTQTLVYFFITCILALLANKFRQSTIINTTMN